MKYFKLLRVKNYIKNLMILLPLFFSKRLFCPENSFRIIFSLLSFCALSSAVYIINDLCDKKTDKLHPVKRKRPIANGEIPTSVAVILFFILLVICIVANCFVCGSKVLPWVLLAAYLVQNIFYSVKLKQMPILDIAIITAGFVIRVFYGSCVFDIELSKWMYLTVIGASFYLGLSKRRNELAIVENNSTRSVLNYYNYNFIDKNMNTCSAVTIVFYSLWCIDGSAAIDFETNYLIWTVPIVILICITYNYCVEKSGKDDIVDILFGNKALLILIVFYCLSVLGIIYL